MAVEVDAQDAAVFAGLHPTRPMAGPASLALEAEGGCGAAVFERAADAAPDLEPLEGHGADLAGLRAHAGHPAAFVMNDDVGAPGEQRSRDRPGRVMARLLLLDPPHQARVDQRADMPPVPQPRLQAGVVETAVGAEIGAAPGHLRRLGEQLLQHPGQHPGFRCRRPRHLEGHRNLVVRVGDQVQPVAEPRLHLLPHRAGLRVHPARLVPAPVRIGVRGLPPGPGNPARRVARHRLAVVAEMATEVRQLLEQRGAQTPDHPRHKAALVLKAHHAPQEPREVPGARHRRAQRRRTPHRAPCAKRHHRRTLQGQRLEPANLKQCRVAAQLTQQRLHRGMLEHDPRDQSPPHRPHRVVVATPASTRLKRSHNLLVGKRVEHHTQTLKVRKALHRPPRKG